MIWPVEPGASFYMVGTFKPLVPIELVGSFEPVGSFKPVP